MKKYLESQVREWRVMGGNLNKVDGRKPVRQKLY